MKLAFGLAPLAPRLQGLDWSVLQWYICRMEGWFATDWHHISGKFWEEVGPMHSMPCVFGIRWRIGCATAKPDDIAMSPLQAVRHREYM